MLARHFTDDLTPSQRAHRKDEWIHILEPYRKNLVFVQAVLTWRLPISSALFSVVLQSTLWYVLVLRDGTLFALTAKLIAGTAVADFCFTLLRVHFKFYLLPIILKACVYDDPTRELMPLEDVVDRALDLTDECWMWYDKLITLRRDHPEQFVALVLLVSLVMMTSGAAVGSDMALLCATASALCLAPPAIARGYHTNPHALTTKLVSDINQLIRTVSSPRFSEECDATTSCCTPNDRVNDIDELLAATPSHLGVIGKNACAKSGRNKDNMATGSSGDGGVGDAEDAEDAEDDDNMWTEHTAISGLNTPESRDMLENEQMEATDKCLLTEDESTADGYKWLGKKSKDGQPRDDDQFQMIHHEDASDNDNGERRDCSSSTLS